MLKYPLIILSVCMLLLQNTQTTEYDLESYMISRFDDVLSCDQSKLSTTERHEIMARAKEYVSTSFSDVTVKDRDYIANHFPYHEIIHAYSLEDFEYIDAVYDTFHEEMLLYNKRASIRKGINGIIDLVYLF